MRDPNPKFNSFLNDFFFKAVLKAPFNGNKVTFKIVCLHFKMALLITFTQVSVLLILKWEQHMEIMDLKSPSKSKGLHFDDLYTQHRDGSSLIHAVINHKTFHFRNDKVK